ncbi:NUDIX hydrolase [Falsiroseomonas sp.]|uniref:NUDIX hydrolase n=1 Tax=Falsiroseomonas sp. TaxID=2870721 RepID=UPI003566C5FF
MTQQDGLFPRLWRHVEACNNIASPSHLIAFRMGDQQVGWLGADLARALAFFPRDIHFDRDGVALAGKLRGEGARTAALERIIASLAGRGHFSLRGEPFDVRATADGPVLARMDRGALPPFGVISQGVHVNGFVRRQDGLHLWCGWRSKHKPVAPGQMDNIVAGGIPAGLDAERTLVKEAAEEASLPAELATQAVPAGRVSYVMANEEGLRRDVLHCYDLELPEGFVPRPQDDEVERFELRPAAAVLEEVATANRVKFNVNLVLIDFFLRHGLLPGLTEAEVARLRAGLDQVG